MNKLTVAISVILLGGLAAYVASFRPKVTPPSQNQERMLSAEIVRIPHGRVLYVVVDFDGVYLGETKIAPGVVKDVISRVMKEQKIRNLVIYGTTYSRYGDAIDLYANLDPALLRWRTFDFHAVPVGTRKPMTGYLQPMCCGSYDSENDPSGP